MNSDDVWYFAYGSNLSKGQKQGRTGIIREGRRARLRGYRLAFNKQGSAGNVYGNIVPDAESEVWGVVFLCNPRAMMLLDRNEGVASGHYTRSPVTVVLDDGNPLDAEAYIAGEPYVVKESSPPPEYLATIVTGAREHGLPEDYIAQIEQRAGLGGSSGERPE